MNTFSIREAVKFGWTEFKKYPWVYIGASLIMLVLSGLSNIPVFGIVVSIVSMVASMGYMKIALDAIDGKKPDVGTLFSQWGKFLRVLGLTVIFMLIMAIPLLLMVAFFGFSAFTSNVAGHGSTSSLPLALAIMLAFFAIILYVAMRLFFAVFFIVDRNAKIMESIKWSSAATKGHRWQLLGLLFVIMLINILGIIALVVGSLVSMAVGQIAMAYAYRKLTSSSTSSTVPVEETPSVTPQITTPIEETPPAAVA